MKILKALALLLCALPALAQQGGGPGGGTPPSGVAGGDLSGTYPNPTVPKLANFGPITQYVNCTGAYTTDTALLAAAAATGGAITLTANCVVNANTTLISNTLFNGNGYKITSAAAANWPGAVCTQPNADVLIGATNATNVVVENTTFDLTTCDQTSKAIAFTSTGYSKISVLNNNCTAVPGNCTAITNATDVIESGNKAYGCGGGCFGTWNVTGDLIVTDNIASLITSASHTNAYGYVFTGGNTAFNAATVTTNWNVSHNIVYINGQSAAGDIGFYVQGWSGTCAPTNPTSPAYITIADNQVVVAAGFWGDPIYVNGCAQFGDIHDNIITGDGATTGNLPAIEVTATAVGFQIHDNVAVNFLGQTVGSDNGIFTNRGTKGSIVNNKALGTSSAVLVGTTVGAGTIVYGNDNGAGIENHANPVNFTSATTPTVNGVSLPYNLYNWGIPIGIPPSGSFANNGVYVIGQAPSGSATCETDRTANGTADITCSAATLLNTAADVGRVFTINDSGTYRYFTITAQKSTTAATGTISNGPLPAISATISGVAITGVAGQFSCTCTGFVVGMGLTLSGTYGGTGSITGYANPTTYYVSATNGTSTFTLQSAVGTAIVTTAGTPSGITYTPVGSATLANANVFLSGTPTTNTTAFSVPLNTVYASTYLYFFSNVICSNSGNCGGSAQNAGIFYATCVSTTVCTVFNNTIASNTTGLPTIPTSPTAFVSTGAGAFTQQTGLVSLVNLAIPANTLGPNGSLVMDILGVRNSNADTVAFEPFWNGIQMAQLSVVSVVWYGFHRTIRNMGVANAQSLYCATCAAAATDATTANNATTYSAIDTTASQNMNVKVSLATAGTDWFFMQGGTVTANYAP